MRAIPQAYRTTCVPAGNRVEAVIPDEYVGTEVEIIVLPLDRGRDYRQIPQGRKAYAQARHVGMENALSAMPVPRTKEFEARISEAYEKYADSKPSAVENTRLREPGKDIFDWLMEDRESTRMADEMIMETGWKW
jgi:hypothetical protein